MVCVMPCLAVEESGVGVMETTEVTTEKTTESTTSKVEETTEKAEPTTKKEKTTKKNEKEEEKEETGFMNLATCSALIGLVTVAR